MSDEPPSWLLTRHTSWLYSVIRSRASSKQRNLARRGGVQRNRTHRTQTRFECGSLLVHTLQNFAARTAGGAAHADTCVGTAPQERVVGGVFEPQRLLKTTISHLHASARHAERMAMLKVCHQETPDQGE